MAEKKKKKSADAELRALLQKAAASDFVGPPSLEPINAPYGYERPGEGLRFRHRRPGMVPPLISPVAASGRQTGAALVGAKQAAHPAEGYYGGRLENVAGGNVGSRMFMPGYGETPLRPASQFYPPPTISNEEQEMIDGGRPQGVIPEALIRPVAPAAPQLPPEMLRRAPEARAPRTAQGMVVEKFGGDMNAYNKWWGSLPQSMKPRSWEQGVPKATPEAAPTPAPQATGDQPSEPAAFIGPPAPEVQEAVERNPEAFFHPLGNAPNNAVWEVSSSVGKRTDPKTGVKGALHEGTDFRAKVGTPLLAMQGGTVTYNRDGGGAGNRIQITYDNGAVVKYFHMDKRSKLEEGARVKPGQVVGAVGLSGRTTGAHLHAELRMKNPKTGKVEIHDLEKYLKAKGSPATYGDTLLPPGHSKGDGHKH